jgi:glycine/D-amino acid oxidase-like deaminating enzyme
VIATAKHSSPDVLVVGGGIAGLACAFHLRRAGLRPLVLEGSDDVGGRVRTDELDGFRLNRGFHVFPTACVEARLVLDYARLDLRPLARGAIVRSDGRFHRVEDPRESAVHGVKALAGGVVEMRDVADTGAGARTAPEALHEPALTAPAIDRLYAPFLRGVLIEPSLDTSTRFLDFVLGTFSEGPGALPARGMGAIPEQLAEGVDVRTRATVSAVGPGTAVLAGGERLEARVVVVAAAGLVDDARHGWNGVSCLYFEAPEPPLPGAWLVVGDEEGPIATLCAVSEVAPEYAPAGRTLLGISVLDPADPDLGAVRAQLSRWFGEAARGWRHLRTYRIPRALPSWPADARLDTPPRLAARLYACGDHREHPSLNGALASGRRAAEAVLADLSARP